MKITIKYDSSWRNSFLDGDNNEQLPKNGRKYIASITELGKKRDKKTKVSANFIQRKIEKETVLGVLNRLIGRQKKLYQIKDSSDDYFEDIEHDITFMDKSWANQEMVYLRNISGSTDQKSFTGAIKGNSPIFSSEFSGEFWGVLNLDINNLIRFISEENFSVKKCNHLDPVSIVNLIEDLKKTLKPVEATDDLLRIAKLLTNHFSETVTEKVLTPYIENTGKINLIRFYAAALYLQQERLSHKYDTSAILTNRGTISGFSKRGYNGKRDFMKAYTTGNPKKIWGNPFIHEHYSEGGKQRHLMNKASGTLDIILDITKERAKEIRQMIYNAGVSSFYLGKKGLAYVEDISVREER